MLKYIIEEQEVEINHDPLLTNRSVSARGDQFNSRQDMIRGDTLTAIFENINDLQFDAEFDFVKSSVKKFKKMSPNNRG